MTGRSRVVPFPFDRDPPPPYVVVLQRFSRTVDCEMRCVATTFTTRETYRPRSWPCVPRSPDCIAHAPGRCTGCGRCHHDRDPRARSAESVCRIASRSRCRPRHSRLHALAASGDRDHSHGHPFGSQHHRVNIPTRLQHLHMQAEPIGSLVDRARHPRHPRVIVEHPVQLRGQHDDQLHALLPVEHLWHAGELGP